MKIQLIVKSAQRAPVKRTVVADWLRVGRNASCEIHLPDPRVALEDGDDERPAHESPVDAALPPSYIVSEFASQAMIVIGDDDKGAPTSRLDLVQPVAGEIFGAGQEIHLEALGVTVDGELDRGVDFYAGDKLIGSSPPSLLLRPTIQCLPSSHRIVWKDAPSGVHTLSARYTLPMGEKIISPPISIRVKGCDLPVVSVVHVPTPYALPDTDYVPGYFRFERTGSMDLPLHVFFELGGTATPGVDYESVGRQVVIAAGESSVALTFKAIDDKFPEGRESIVVRLAMPGESLNQPYPHEYRIDPQHAVAEVLMFDNDLPSEVASLEWSQPREGDSFSFGQSIELIVVAVDTLAEVTPETRRPTKSQARVGASAMRK